MNGIYIFLAPGYEPLEALAPMDVLRRAKLDAKFVSLTESRLVPSTQQYAIQADLTWDDFLSTVDTSSNEGCIIFPGGLPGADNLSANTTLMDMAVEHFKAGGLTCAICAAPDRVIAGHLGGLNGDASLIVGRNVTVYEGFEKRLEEAGASCKRYKGVVVDGNLITAKGPGLAIDFALAVLQALVDCRVYDVVKKAMML